MSRCLTVQIDNTPISLLKAQHAKNHDILFFVSSDPSPKFLNLYYIQKNTQQVMHCFVRTKPHVSSNEELVVLELLFRGVFKEPVYPTGQDAAARQQIRKQHLYDCITRHQVVFGYEASCTFTQEEIYSPRSPRQLSKTASYTSQRSLDPFEDTPAEQNRRSEPLPIIPRAHASPTLFKQPAQSPTTKNSKGRVFKCMMC